MKRVIALVGRPNVGKSTLFNRLTRSRDALVADKPGLTRDRRYGRATLVGREFIIVDTGGLSSDDAGLDELVAGQAMQAVEESDLVLFLVDGRDGMTGEDEIIAQRLRATGKSVLLVVNKTERLNKAVAGAEFYAMGLGDPMAIAAAHGEGVPALIDHVLEQLPLTPEEEAEAAQETEEDEKTVKVAIIGRPNVGKSTLVNRLLGEERVLAFDMPGTTRDSIYIPFEHDGQAYTLIDTAGVRRRAKVDDAIEKFSVIKTLKAMDDANVVVLVIDAHEGVSAQDSTLLGYAIDAGKGLLIAINKWDGLSRDERERVKAELERKLVFAEYADRHYISALHGSGVGKLMAMVHQAHVSAFKTFSTSMLTRILEDAVGSHPPPSVGGRRIKLRYAHQGGKNPPRIIIHGNQTERVPDAYRRYLINTFRKVLELKGTPVMIEFRTSENPYKGRRNKLTPRQERKRKRMLKHYKRK